MLRIVAVICLLLSSTALADGSNSYVIFPDTTNRALTDNQSRIESVGGRVVHVFPPNQFLCVLDSAAFTKLVSESGASGILISGLSEFRLGEVVEQNHILRAFRNIRLNESSMAPGTAPEPQPYDTVGCGLENIDLSADLPFSAEPNISFFPRSKMYSTNFLIGKVAVCIVLMESNGGNENWTSSEEDGAIAQVILAYDKLAEQAAYHNVTLSWVYEIHRAVPTPEEPIATFYPQLEGLNWQFGWMDDAWSYLGMGEEWDALFANANRVRQQYECNWGLTYFLVKNDHHPRGFLDQSIAGYTKTISELDILTPVTHRAPFAVSTYSTVYSYGREGNRTIAHETLHAFGATDEYGPISGIPGNGPDQCNGLGSCDKEYGFLRHRNLNCFYCSEAQENCIMRGSYVGYYLCSHTLRHIGWTDTDNDLNPDAIDPNSSSWATLHSAHPGDLLRIYTLSGSFVNGIGVTNDLIDVQNGTTLLWDCLDYESHQVAPATYYYTINDGAPQAFTLNPRNLSILPSVTSLSYLQDTLRWEIPNSFCYLTLDVECYKWKIDDTVRLTRKLWNQFHLSSVDKPHKKVPMADVLCDPCFARFHTWRPDGANVTTSFQFSTYKCGDWTGNRIVDLSDLSACINYLTVPGKPDTPAPLIAKDVNCSGNIDLSDLSGLYAFLTLGRQLRCCY